MSHAWRRNYAGALVLRRFGAGCFPPSPSSCLFFGSSSTSCLVFFTGAGKRAFNSFCTAVFCWRRVRMSSDWNGSDPMLFFSASGACFCTSWLLTASLAAFVQSSSLLRTSTAVFKIPASTSTWALPTRASKRSSAVRALVKGPKALAACPDLLRFSAQIFLCSAAAFFSVFASFFPCLPADAGAARSSSSAESAGAPFFFLPFFLCQHTLFHAFKRLRPRVTLHWHLVRFNAQGLIENRRTVFHHAFIPPLCHVHGQWQSRALDVCLELQDLPLCDVPGPLGNQKFLVKPIPGLRIGLTIFCFFRLSRFFLISTFWKYLTFFRQFLFEAGNKWLCLLKTEISGIKKDHFYIYKKFGTFL